MIPLAFLIYFAEKQPRPDENFATAREKKSRPCENFPRPF
jgi:hypothetical protein